MKISHVTNIFSINDLPVVKHLLDDGTKSFIFCSNFPVKVHYGNSLHNYMSCNRLTIRNNTMAFYHIAQLVLRFCTK